MTWLKLLIMRQQNGEQHQDDDTNKSRQLLIGKRAKQIDRSKQDVSKKNSSSQMLQLPRQDNSMFANNINHKLELRLDNSSNEAEKKNVGLEKQINNLPNQVQEVRIIATSVFNSSQRVNCSTNEAEIIAITQQSTNHLSALNCCLPQTKASNMFRSLISSHNQLSQTNKKSAPYPHKIQIKHNQSMRPPLLALIMNCLIASISLLLLAASTTSFNFVLAAGANAADLQQYFEAQPDAHYNVPVGNDIRLRCIVRNRQGECAWLRNGRIVGPIQKKYSFSKAPLDGDCSLSIRNVSVALDDGHWQCQVLSPEIDQDALQTRDAHLVILVAPERPQIKNLSQGTNAKLVLEESKQKFVTCEIRGGNPAPQIEWFLDGKNLTKDAQTIWSGAQTPIGQRVTQSKLKLSDLKRTLNGKNLTCVGVHQMVNQSTSAELDVQYVPTVSVMQREYSIVEGSPLSISCQVDSNPPASLINWRLVNDGASRSGAANNKEALLANKQGPVLEFVRIGREYNQNTFECLAQNSLGVSSPADVKLNVLYTPFLLNTSHSDSISLNTEAHLTCLFEGNPQPEIRWFYTDPLSRTATALLVDPNQIQQQQQNSQHQQQSQPQQQQVQVNVSSVGGRQQLLQHQLIIRNVTYRNEGDYHCEARNSINGEQYAIRSSNIGLDIYGEPQFLVGRTPLQAKAVQGSRADIALTFCSDPQPLRVYWQFGSIRLEVRTNFFANSINNANQLTTGNGQQQQQMAPPAALTGKLAHSPAVSSVMQRFQVHPLVPLQKRDSSFSKVPTCFEATLSLLDPELTDQRDYNLFVQNERGLSSGIVRLRVNSPLSPALMITSAFVFICGLFLCSLLFLFAFKKRHHLLNNLVSNAQQQPQQQQQRSNSANSKRSSSNGHLKGNNGKQQQNGTSNGTTHEGGAINQTTATTNGNGLLQITANGQQQQSKGLVNGLGNGLANGAGNPIALGSEQEVTKSGQLHHGLMSMASSETSCTNDQKQLLANCSSSDRNSSSASSSTNGMTANGNLNQIDFSTVTSTERSSANSSPASTALHHISVDDEIQLNGSYQATESVTCGAQLSPTNLNLLASSAANGNSALIYANIGDFPSNTIAALSNQQNKQNCQAYSPSNGHYLIDQGTLSAERTTNSTLASNNKLTVTATNRASLTRRRQQQMPSMNDNPSSPGDIQANHQALMSDNNDSGLLARPSVGATIAMMNSLAAAASLSPNNGQNVPNPTGALTGAINQQLAANSAASRQVRKPGPPKPPKPSIEQRSRFYQQQQQQQQQQHQQAPTADDSGGLVMIGNSQLGFNKYPEQTTGAESKSVNPITSGLSANDLAAEYSRLAFPARAEL